MKKIQTIAIDNQVSYVLTLQVLLFFFIGGAVFTGITGTNDLNVNGWLAIGTYIVTIVLHEILHGIGFMIAKAKPRFGVGLAGVMPIAYATADKRISVRSMLMVAYLPLIVLSVFFILLAVIYPEYQQIALIGFLGNFTGAVGDAWMASKLWKYINIKDVLVRDTKAGIEIYSTNKIALAIASRSKEKEVRRLQFGKQWAIASIAILGVQILTPIILVIVGFKGNFKLGYGEFYLFETTVGDGGATAGATFNLLAPILMGLLFTFMLRTIQKISVKNNHY